MRKTIAIVLAMTLSACAGVNVEEYQSRGPVFSAESFFSGSLTAHGVVKNYRGYASRSFVADIRACWEDGVGTLDERFVFDDGEKQTRVWRLTRSADGSYAATAGDVRGEGRASTSGSSMFLGTSSYPTSMLDLRHAHRPLLLRKTHQLIESAARPESASRHHRRRIAHQVYRRRLPNKP